MAGLTRPGKLAFASTTRFSLDPERAQEVNGPSGAATTPD